MLRYRTFDKRLHSFFDFEPIHAVSSCCLLISGLALSHPANGETLNNEASCGNPSIELLLVSPDTDLVPVLHASLQGTHNLAIHLEVAQGEDSCIEKLSGHHYGAVLIDVDGLSSKQTDLVTAMRVLTPTTPIVMLTDDGEGSDVQNCSGLDGVYRISKTSIGSELFCPFLGCIADYGKMIPFLRASEERCHTFLEQSTDAILIVSPDRKLRFLNDGARLLLGLNTGETNDEAFDFPLTEGNITEVRIPRENGEAMTAEMMTGAITWEGNPAYLVTLRDISKRKKADELAQQRALELQARNEELDAFAHMVAHDLKNPLGVISGFVEMLEEDCGRMPEEQLRSLLQAIGHAASKMHNIVEGLLLLAGVRKKQRVRTEPLEMAAISQEAQQRLSHLAEEYGATVARPDKWPTAIGYAPWIEEVWVNYVSNAIKHGGDPPHVEMGATTLDSGLVKFWVRDNGPGIPDKEQMKLFTPFTRLSQVRSKGYGLGLSIVQRIVEKLGGEVGVESEVGSGSLFYFTLPSAEEG